MLNAVRDTLGRPLRSLRLSVTDRCNLRCAYCMPEAAYPWLPRADILAYEEMAALVDAFVEAGVRDLHVTGGEPLVRRDVDRLIRLLTARPALADIALTTNGTLLDGRAKSLRAAGLHRLTVSLDTLRPDRFRALARGGELERVLAGVRAARAAGFDAIAINSVVIRGRNDDELVELLALGGEVGAEVRFIEYMDVGGATRWRREDVVGRDEMVARIAATLGAVTPLPRNDSAPAERFALADGRTFGVIASVTAPFCRTCDRARLTADGHWYRCLYAREGLDLRTPLRAGASRGELRAIIEDAWSRRDDRGAERRAEAEQRPAPATVRELRADPHLEMHAKGG